MRHHLVDKGRGGDVNGKGAVAKVKVKGAVAAGRRPWSLGDGGLVNRLSAPEELAPRPLPLTSLFRATSSVGSDVRDFDVDTVPKPPRNVSHLGHGPVQLGRGVWKDRRRALEQVLRRPVRDLKLASELDRAAFDLVEEIEAGLDALGGRSRIERGVRGAWSSQRSLLEKPTREPVEAVVFRM